MLKTRIFTTAVILLLFIHLSIAHVALDFPKGGESFQLGNTITIQWTEVINHGDANWDLLFSKDAGETWDTIRADIDLMTLEYNWEPAVETDSGIIRIIQDNEVGLIYHADSEAFEIKSLSTSTFAIDPGKFSLGVYPNPMSKYTLISFSTVRNRRVALDLLDREGRHLVNIYAGRLENGYHSFPFKSSDFPQGVYYCRITDGEFLQSKKILKVN